MKPEELQNWRTKAGYTQKDLAEKLGVTVVCISRWENGAREIPSFLHLALECMERKGDESKSKGTQKNKKKGR